MLIEYNRKLTTNASKTTREVHVSISHIQALTHAHTSTSCSSNTLRLKSRDSKDQINLAQELLWAIKAQFEDYDPHVPPKNNKKKQCKQ